MAEEKRTRFKPTMTWAEYLTELNKLCEELNTVSEELKKNKEKNDDTPKR